MILRVLNTIFLGICAASLAVSLYLQYQQISLLDQQVQALNNSSVQVDVPNQQEQGTDPWIYQKNDHNL